MILPEIYVRIEKVESDEYKVTVEDNGPGIIKKAIPNVFGRLLYGSRFHAVRQSRGQQGIGIIGHGHVRPDHHRKAGHGPLQGVQ